ncbi:sensor histidine kinase RegB [Roseicitreum antarcticum]|uniref:histidine kinase n=1 Tax=Roseicitreum antarcticum TaxID=564137 RepID=A0A1H3BIK2_9RHOB|nr:ActS/PrrB/RegB family redox-sensitive histidine kinase [Roseicitreum antarcticum]SDX41790.1 two-component system, sensor histidine kinase RegB [Roseicitreum antarcticum]
MPSPTLAHLNRDSRGQWVRLRTLTMLRWLAVAGQLIAITAADQFFGLQFNLGLCYLAVGTAVISNLVTLYLFPENKRLSESDAMLTLLFDVSQLALLLYLTGGITNPFALLMLAPVTISASALEVRTTMFLGGVAISLISLVALIYEPLTFADGSILTVPPIIAFGFWAAIVIGIVFMGLYARRVASEIHSMADALLATQMALAREQKLTDLGGVVAATAHELGTPLATIKLVSAELMTDLPEGSPQREDVQLIRDQAERCREILHSMGRAGKDDLHLRHVPLDTLLREAAEPHTTRNREVIFTLTPALGAGARQPLVRRKPEIVHGLRNLIQNAVDFAAARVWLDGIWTDQTITIRIMDDGPGFPPDVLSRIGDPFIRRRRDPGELLRRPEYEGMGLGLFIAKTLLERTGAEISFANCTPATGTGDRDRRGALIELVWPLDRLTPLEHEISGQNPQIAS